MSQVLKESLAKSAKDAKVFLGGLGVFARENIFSCFVSLRHGFARDIDSLKIFTNESDFKKFSRQDAEALREKIISSMPLQSETWHL